MIVSEYALHKMHGYGAAPRRPLLPLKEAEGEAFMLALQELLDVEAKLAKQEASKDPVVKMEKK